MFQPITYNTFEGQLLVDAKVAYNIAQTEKSQIVPAVLCCYKKVVIYESAEVTCNETGWYYELMEITVWNQVNFPKKKYKSQKGYEHFF